MYVEALPLPPASALATGPSHVRVVNNVVRLNSAYAANRRRLGRHASHGGSGRYVDQGGREGRFQPYQKVGSNGPALHSQQVDARPANRLLLRQLHW